MVEALGLRWSPFSGRNDRGASCFLPRLYVYYAELISYFFLFDRLVRAVGKIEVMTSILSAAHATSCEFGILGGNVMNVC